MKIHSHPDPDVVITWHENVIPDFVEAELERLYQSIFSSIAMLRIYDSTEQISTYVARKESHVLALFLFRCNRNRISVCNEVIKIAPQEISRFSTFIFKQYPASSAITFRAFECGPFSLPYPMQRFNALEDIVLPLPARVEDYLARLGKSTRASIRGYMNRLLRAFPSYRLELKEAGRVNEQDVLRIIALHRQRMAQKNRVTNLDDAEIRRILQLCRVCGLVGTVVLNDKICAGFISYRIGTHYFMNICAHDPAYDQYRLGTLSGFLNISACIERGGQQCHLLWGQHDYKYRFLGQQRDLDNLAIYRSVFAMVNNAGLVARMSLDGGRRFVRRLLQRSRQLLRFIQPFFHRLRPKNKPPVRNFTDHAD